MHGTAATTLTSEQELRAILGSPSEGVKRKKIRHFEAAARTFIGRAPFAAMVTRGPDGLVDVAAHGGAPGFVRVVDAATLLIPTIREDVRAAVRTHPFAGLIFLIPGVNETLRVNGRAEVVDPGSHAETAAIRLTIEEQFLHCPKAFVRSRLWDTPYADVPAHLAANGLTPGMEQTLEQLDARCRAFIARAPFLLLGTSLPDGQTDVSPRGDPAGFVHMLDERTLLLPDRPGNRLADSFRNVLAHPFAGLLLLVPGEPVTLRVRACASIIHDPELLAPLAVRGKAPLLGLRLEVVSGVLAYDEALHRARLWDHTARIDRASFPSIGELLATQLNPECAADGVQATAVDEAIRRDAENNLY